MDIGNCSVEIVILKLIVDGCVTPLQQTSRKAKLIRGIRLN